MLKEFILCFTTEMDGKRGICAVDDDAAADVTEQPQQKKLKLETLNEEENGDAKLDQEQELDFCVPDDDNNNDNNNDDDDDDDDFDIDDILTNSYSEPDFGINDVKNPDDFVGSSGNPAGEADNRSSLKAVDYARAASVAEIKARGIEIPGMSKDNMAEIAKKFESPSYDSMPFDQVEEIMRAVTEETTKSLQISTDMAIILLRRNSWDAQAVIKRYTEERDALLDETGLSFRAAEVDDAPEAQGTFTCSICEDDIEVSNSIALGCGHRFCKECWAQAISIKMMEGWTSEIATTLCPGYKCKYPVPDSVIIGLLDSADGSVKKFKEAAARQFVRVSDHTKWCPGRGCDFVLHAQKDIANNLVMCKGCSLLYCYKCNDYDIGDHRPCSCEQMEEWTKRSHDESETIRWQEANTKRCPNCHVPIEKNGGCMHMTCSKEIGGCGHEWCWLCRGPWSEHSQKTGGYYACNKYGSSQAKKMDDEATKVKNEIEHYMFYFHRYDAHRDTRMKALAYLSELPEKEKRLRNLCIENGNPQTDFSFLFDAVSTIIESCRTLAYSYIYGFFIKEGDPMKELFEYTQENLEKFSVRLTEIYELSLNSNLEDFYSKRSELIDLTKVTLKYLESFNESIKERK